MPRTETEPTTSSALPVPVPVPLSVPAAALTAAPPRPLPRGLRPLRGPAGELLLDWKDLGTAIAALVLLARATTATSALAVWLGLAVLSALAPVVRRLTVGGPKPIVRHGVGWGLARVVGGVSLFVGAGVLAFLSTIDVVQMVIGSVLVAIGATIDHVARIPPEKT